MNVKSSIIRQMRSDVYIMYHKYEVDNFDVVRVR
jgi:hypothetical protein